jgi:HEPN domain-containing protein
MPQPPGSQAEFDAVMGEIDAHLRQKYVQIHARAGHAALEYSGRFNLEFSIAKADDVGTPRNYRDAKVGAHIRAWFDRKYGDRQKIFMGPGTTVLLIRGDPWEIRLPLIYGEVECVVERNLETYRNEPRFGAHGRRPVVNVLSLVRDLPPGLAAQLTDSECWNILKTFRDTLDCMHAVGYLAGKPYIAEVRADVAASVVHLFSLPPHYGQSKWASCQAAEKLLKCLLEVRKVPFPKNHDLEALAVLARQQGAKVDSAAIARVAASASVRYGEVSVSLDEAVAAHYSSLLTAQLVYEAFETKV